jgi:HmuY protein
MTAPGARPPVLLVATLIGFAAFLGVLVVQSVAPKRVQVFAPAARDATVPAPVAGAIDTVTLDARDEDRWRFFDLDRGMPQLSPDTAGWDLAVRRFRIIVAGDGVADLGATPFDSVAAAPSEGFVRTDFARDTGNAALAHWYRYSFLSHVLRPGGHVYVTHTDAGRYAKIEILSYYCPGPDAGCLTFRYGLSGAGARSFR